MHCERIEGDGQGWEDGRTDGRMEVEERGYHTYGVNRSPIHGYCMAESPLAI